MKSIFIHYLISISISLAIATSQTQDEYFQKRDEILNKEHKISMAGSQKLSIVEQVANEVLKNYKSKEIRSGIANPGHYLPLQSISDFENKASSSKVFQIIQKMPKGALLHTHSYGMSSSNFIFDATKGKDNLYVCFDGENGFEMKFLNDPECDKNCTWISVEEKRNCDPFFDDFLKEKLSMNTKTVDQVDIVKSYNDLVRIVSGFLSNKPTLEEYIYAMLVELNNDNIKHVEIRIELDKLSDADGNVYDYHAIIAIYQQVLANFQKQNGFFSMKLIYNINRNLPMEEIQKRLENFKDMKQKYGNFISGIDFSAPEDTSRPIKELIPILLALKDDAMAGNYSAEFFMQAGDTNWYGTDADENLVDALMFKCPRISHALALAKHPKLMQMVKQNGVAIEITPLADVAMGMVTDIRNHPAAILSALGVNLVIANDTLGLWGASGVSYDWYLAFMGFASARDDLGYLKKLALNSIQYSALPKTEKLALLQIWEQEWGEFVLKLARGELV